MKLEQLEVLVKNHSGEFLCEQINNNTVTKIVSFEHVYDPPLTTVDLPKVGKLKEFYATFGSLTLYFNKESDDAAVYIAPPDRWKELDQEFKEWLESLDEDEREELLPKWINNCLSIGNIPRSGNYILVPLEGEDAGHIFLFDHDGFEFSELAKNIEDYINSLLHPDSRALVDMATHMRFVEDNPLTQWWIRELRDNEGNVITTKK